MKELHLSQGQVALVDDEDYADLSQFKWSAYWNPHTRSYYAQRGIRLPNGKTTSEKMHRRILGLKRGDRRQGDHRNHATLDNRRSNIRIVTHTENGRNRRGKGFSRDTRRKKYMACIQVNGVTKHLGSFDTAMDAHVTYLFAKAALHPTAELVVMV